MKRIIDMVSSGDYVTLNDVIEKRVAERLVTRIQEEKEKFIDSCKKAKSKGQVILTKSGSKTTNTSSGTSEE